MIKKLLLILLTGIIITSFWGCSADDPLTDKLFITDISGEDAEFESLTSEDSEFDNAYIANLIATGDITIGANKLKTTNLLIKEYSAYFWVLRNATDTDYVGIFCNLVSLGFGHIEGWNNAYLQAGNEDGDVFLLKAKDSGVGQVEIARLQGAADPYFAMGGSQEFKFYNSGVADFGGAATVTANVSWLPSIDGTWSIGSDAKRLALVRAVSVTSGDLGFEETTCHLCGKPFKVGDKICLIVVAVEDGSIKTVPICRDCFLKD